MVKESIEIVFDDMKGSGSIHSFLVYTNKYGQQRALIYYRIATR